MIHIDDNETASLFRILNRLAIKIAFAPTRFTWCVFCWPNSCFLLFLLKFPARRIQMQNMLHAYRKLNAKVDTKIANNSIRQQYCALEFWAFSVESIQCFQFQPTRIGTFGYMNIDQINCRESKCQRYSSIFLFFARITVFNLETLTICSNRPVRALLFKSLC